MREREGREVSRPKPQRAAASRPSEHFLLALQVSAGNRAVSELVAGQVQRLEMSARLWEHVSQGVVGESSVTGYHWTGRGDVTPVRKVPSEGPVAGPDGRGVYKANVESRAEVGTGAKKKRLKKSKPSTFFPDAWSATRVKWAIKNAKDRGNQTAEVVNPHGRDHGMMLFHNPDSAFPMDVG